MQIPAKGCEKVSSDLGDGNGFYRVLLFPPPLTSGLSRLRQNMAEEVKMKLQFAMDMCFG